MSETVDSSSGGEAQGSGDASPRVTTTGVVESPEVASAGSRWTPGRIFAVALAVAVVAFLASKAADDLGRFLVVTLNGLSLAALFFVVASGFTLIFGLMRV